MGSRTREIVIVDIFTLIGGVKINNDFESDRRVTRDAWWCKRDGTPGWRAAGGPMPAEYLTRQCPGMAGDWGQVAGGEQRCHRTTGMSPGDNYEPQVVGVSMGPATGRIRHRCQW